MLEFHGVAYEKAGPPPGSDAERVLEAMGYDPLAVDTLVERTGLDAARLTRVLVELELCGRVENRGGTYQRLP